MMRHLLRGGGGGGSIGVAVTASAFTPGVAYNGGKGGGGHSPESVYDSAGIFISENI